MRSVILIGLLIVGGCTHRIEARQNMRASLATYKECLAENAKNPDACETQRRVYEADVDALKAIGPGNKPVFMYQVPTK